MHLFYSLVQLVASATLTADYQKGKGFVAIGKRVSLIRPFYTGGNAMVRLRLPPEEKLSEAVMVLLRPGEREVLAEVAEREGKGLGAMLREVFVHKYSTRCAAGD